MKVTVVTTIAQHSKGYDLHLQNLRWAINPNLILVQTFKKWNLSKHEDVKLIEVDSNPYEFYFFWDHIDLRPYLPETDVFLFTEQDILFTRPIRANTQQIYPCLESNYLAIFDKGIKLYPRIWEGACFIPKQFIEDAINDGILFGSHSKKNHKLYDTVKYLNTVVAGNSIAIKDYLSSYKFFDTLFELSLYCFHKQYSHMEINENFTDNYDWGRDCVHLRGIDMMCYECEELYNNPSAIELVIPRNIAKGSIKALRRMINDCALALLLCGAWEPNEETRALLLRGDCSKILNKVSMLSDNCDLWMTKKQIEILRWAND